MPLVPEELARIDALLAALGEDAEAQGFDLALRRLVPGVTCRHCDASDVLEEPFRQAGSIDLHLLDASGHCIRVTDNPEEATALLIAGRQPAQVQS